MRFSVLSTSVLLLAALPNWAPAQIKLPVFDESKGDIRNVAYEDAARHSDYQHGKLLRITLKAEPKAPVSGILVRTDPKTRKIYVRTQPGSPPQAIALNDVQRIEKGTIKQVAYTKDVSEPEIRPLVIYNGARRTVVYEAPTLSPGELDSLAELEAAENQIGSLEDTTRVQEQVLRNDMAMQSELVLTRKWSNQLLARQTIPFQLYGYLPYAAASGFTGYPGLPNYGLPLGQMMYSGLGGAQPANATQMPDPFIRVGSSVFPGLDGHNEKLAAARQKYVAARNRAIYENGHLVAVVGTDDNAKQPAGK